jgi:O-antigen ligase
LRVALTPSFARSATARERRVVTLPQLAATVALSGLAGLTLAIGDWMFAVGLLAAGGLTAVGLVRPALFVAVFLLLRPVMDDPFGLAPGVKTANAGGALGALVVAACAAYAATTHHLFAPRATRALAAVLVVSTVAAAQAVINFGGTVGAQPGMELVRLGAFLAVYVLAANLFGTPERARKLFVLVGVSAVVPAIYGVVQLISGPEIVRESDVARISGTFVGPNPFGAYLALAALMLIFMGDRALPRLVRFGSLAIVLVALTGSYSRMGWVMVLVGLAILGWRDRKGLVAVGLVVVTALCIAIPTVRERAFPFAAEETSSTAAKTSYESYDWRIANWRGLLEQWEQRPLTGHGLETTSLVNPRRLTGQERDAESGFKAHNMAVKMLVEGGVLLLAAYAFFFFAVLGAVRGLARQPWELAGMSRLVYVLWGVVLLAGLATDDPLEFTALMYAMLALTGALEGARYRQQRLAADY